MTKSDDERREATAAGAIERLLEIMAALRDPERGCPWDREQTFETIAPYTIEEAYEVADAIARRDAAALADELGDLLFQVVFHARMAEESGDFAFGDVVDAIVDKMVRRHPHVFAGEEVADAAAQTRAWEAHKAAERRARGESHASRLDGVVAGLPALQRAEKLQRRAARAGFDWARAADVIPKIREELAELEAELEHEGGTARVRDEMGDLLFACVNLARRLEVDPEGVLRDANLKFERRFRAMERSAEAGGGALESLDAEALERLWEGAKAEEGRG